MEFVHAEPEHAREVEWAFEQIPFRALSDGSVAVEVAKPFAVFWIGKVGKAPIVDGFQHARVTVEAGQFPREERGDDGFAVGPPELHILPVFLDRQTAQVGEVEQAAVFFVPTAFPHHVEDAASDLNPACFIAETTFVHEEPSAFDRVAGVEGSAVGVVDDGTVGRDGFHERSEVRFEKVALDGVDAPANPIGEGALVDCDVTEVQAEFLSRHDIDHVRPDPL